MVPREQTQGNVIATLFWLSRADLLYRVEKCETWNIATCAACKIMSSFWHLLAS